MTDETQPATPPADWLTERARLSGLPHPPQPSSLARDWWHALTGGPPDRVTEEPRTGHVELRGAHEHGPLALLSQGNRLDITHPFAEGGAARLPVFTGALPPFVGLMSGWLGQDSAPGFQRLAFNGSLLKHCPRVEDCRRELDHYLPSIDMQATQTTGFMYQVNHLCSSRTIDDLMINRIVRWEIWESRMPDGEAVFALHLELDINTAKEHTGGLDRPAELFAEMANYAGHFALEGDRP